MREPATAAAADGHPLAVRRFPAQGTAWGTVLVAGAMGARQDYYAPFAGFLASQGLHVLTFDYRGSGASRPASLRGFAATVTDWAERDLDAMLRLARAAAPGLPAFAVGHSLGGQLFGAVPEGARLDAIVTVTAGNGYYRLNDRMPARIRIFWFLAVPVLTPLFGYFPGARLGLVGDLPAGVARQWRRWCLHPEYVLSEGEQARRRYAEVYAPILAYSFEDDDLITRVAVDRLHAGYRGALVERRHLTPSQAGAARVGHFGFFSRASKETLWPETLAWLRRAGAR